MAQYEVIFKVELSGYVNVRAASCEEAEQIARRLIHQSKSVSVYQDKIMFSGDEQLFGRWIGEYDIETKAEECEE